MACIQTLLVLACATLALAAPGQALTEGSGFNSAANISPRINVNTLADRQQDCTIAASLINAADGHVTPKDWCPSFVNLPKSTITLTNTKSEVSTWFNTTTSYNLTATETDSYTNMDPTYVWQHTITLTLWSYITTTGTFCGNEKRHVTKVIANSNSTASPVTTTSVPASTTTGLHTLARPTHTSMSQTFGFRTVPVIAKSKMAPITPAASAATVATTAASPLPTWLSGWNAEQVSSACSCLSLTPGPDFTFTTTTDYYTTVTAPTVQYVSTYTFNSTTHPNVKTVWTTWTSIPEVTKTFIPNCPTLPGGLTRT